MAVNQNFELFRGEDGELTVTMDPETDITGWTITFFVKTAEEASGDPLLEVAATITDAEAGVFTVALTAAQTAGLDAGKYRYDIWRLGSGVNTLLTWGKLTMRGQVRVAP